MAFKYKAQWWVNTWCVRQDGLSQFDCFDGQYTDARCSAEAHLLRGGLLHSRGPYWRWEGEEITIRVSDCKNLDEARERLKAKLQKYDVAYLPKELK